MNKKILLFLVLLLPVMINAATCDYDKHKQYTDLAPNITYENNYSKSTDTYNIVIYSIFSNMYATYNNQKLTPDSENKVTISNIKPGNFVTIKIFANDGCDEIKIINEEESYFNKYYGTNDCVGYEKLPACASQFTTTPVTKEYLEEAKKDFDSTMDQRSKKKEEIDNSLIARIKRFITKWGIKIALVVVTTFVFSTIYNSKYRKIKHGI